MWCIMQKDEKSIRKLVQVVMIYGDDIRMEFGIEKWVILIMKSGKIIWRKEENNQVKIKSERSEKWKSINTTINIEHEEMRENIKK